MSTGPKNHREKPGRHEILLPFPWYEISKKEIYHVNGRRKHSPHADALTMPGTPRTGRYSRTPCKGCRCLLAGTVCPDPQPALPQGRGDGFFQNLPGQQGREPAVQNPVRAGRLDLLGSGLHGNVQGPDDRRGTGKSSSRPGKNSRPEFCTVAHWKNGEIVEEKLFYDKMSLLQQIGVI